MIGLAAIVLAAATAPRAYAVTPMQAARQALFVPKNQHVSVVRTNVSGRYAVVLLRRATMEGSPIQAPFLIERFAFGWQPLVLLNFQCGLDVYGLSAATTAALMRGMPQPKNDRPCSSVFNDAGPAADVTAVRALMRGPFVPSVAVSHDYALGNWYGAGGGETLYAKRGGRWRRIAGDGGAMGVEEMKKYGVPRTAWCALDIYNAKC